MSESLKVELREARGKRNMRRMRAKGAIPAVLYGHGEKTISLTAERDALRAAIRHGARVVDLQGAVAEKAFIRDLQWDTYGLEVLHFDLTRVSVDERLTIEVPVELRGEAPGVKNGGVVAQMVHQVEIECLAIAIPEKLTLRINSLQVGEHLNADKIELPEGAKLVTDGDLSIVQCMLPKEETETDVPMGDGAEPEVIGRKAEDEAEED